MFERTFSFWRKLIGKNGSESEGGTAVQEDRRLWVRYQADLATRVQLAQNDQGERFSARIRDVSVGGANLTTDLPFQPGQILSLELPSSVENEQQIVLACVVRATADAEGHWSLGCVFSRELSTEDLEKFGAQKSKPAPEDQRSWVRFDCAVTATYERVGDPSQQTHTAQVLNVSASGVGLLLTQLIEPGCLINLSLTGRHGHPTRAILACVVHSTLRAGGELAVGCNFIRELAEEELEALL